MKPIIMKDNGDHDYAILRIIFIILGLGKRRMEYIICKTKFGFTRVTANDMKKYLLFHKRFFNN
ncbi:MAG TPA: hypothetical protein VFX18_03820 [Candidatus Nitrosocosmicus sp.]|nr:hypothetical protein [Candidatus Nitrosocosmicus sp.]